MEVSCQLRAPAVLPPGKEPPSGTHWIEGWVCPNNKKLEPLTSSINQDISNEPELLV
jgi:hypothetical protein